MKMCTKCGVEKGHEEFSKNARGKDGLQARCKHCEREYRQANADAIKARDREYYQANADVYKAQQREYRQANPDVYKAYRRKSMYGLTAEQYETMLAAQGGGCAICGKECASGRALAVDHDHACCPGTKSCGKCVRGLLCRRCNTSIGHFEDSPALLTAAVAYLTQETA